MGNDLITGVMTRLRDTFGEDTTVYFDEVKQELNEPCFFVRTLEVSQELVVRNRYRRIYHLDIEYHPEDRQQTAREIADVANVMLMAMEYIHIGENLTRGTNIRYEVQDKVLHFFVDYDFFVLKVLEEEEYMETLTQTQYVKG
ncbi:MAG: hypothetical protein IJ712_02575 [Anaerovibrio sp.]|nr:hypothetical protein [Anaerovibrio sp.]